MSMYFVCLGCIFPFTTMSAIKMSVCNSVGGCLCHILSRIILIYIALRAMMYSAASSILVANDMTCLIICAMLSIAALLVGTSAPLERKKWLAALLLVLGSLR